MNEILEQIVAAVSMYAPRILAALAVLVLTGAMALREMGFAEDIVNLTFGLFLGAVAVAAALAFGIGGREAAARQLNQWHGGSSQDDERNT